MPAMTRLGDKCTGHDGCAGVPLVTASPNVFVNGKPVGRINDTYQYHGCIVHSSHADKIVAGSSTVFVNGVPVGRVGDSVSLAGSVAEGSPDVFAN